MPLFLVGLACLLPLAMYCLYMVMVHQRGRPTMLAGSWDFVGILAALSGFLLVGGTTILFAFHNGVRDHWLQSGPIHNLKDVHTRVGLFTFALWGLYFLLLVGGSAYLIGQRRPLTVVYHLTPRELEPMLESAVARLDLPLNRRGARWLIGIIDQPLTPFAKVMSGSSAPVGKGVVEVDGSDAMRYTTLRWQYGTGTLRADVETELAREFAAFSSPSSSATLWFMTIAGGLFVVMIFLLTTFLMVAFR